MGIGKAGPLHTSPSMPHMLWGTRRQGSNLTLDSIDEHHGRRLSRKAESLPTPDFSGRVSVSSVAVQWSGFSGDEEDLEVEGAVEEDSVDDGKDVDRVTSR